MLLHKLCCWGSQYILRRATAASCQDWQELGLSNTIQSRWQIILHSQMHSLLGAESSEVLLLCLNCLGMEVKIEHQLYDSYFGQSGDHQTEGICGVTVTEGKKERGSHKEEACETNTKNGKTADSTKTCFSFQVLW